MNKQTLIDDYKQTIERLQKECTEKTDFNIKLMEHVKELEEKLKIAKKAFKKIAESDICNRCDGVGYIYGCCSSDCAYYIVLEVLKKMDKVENDK